MIALGLFVTLVAWAVVWCVGEATARVLFGKRYRAVATATRLPLGLAATVCLLEWAGFYLPIRIAAWMISIPAAAGAVLVLRQLRRVKLRRIACPASSLLALGVGLVPVAVAGRFTAAALTNNDATYYVTAADWLEGAPWITNFGTQIPPSLCLTERVLHWWHWRTGTPNLMAAVSSLSGFDSTQALAVVTAVLFACAPCAALGIARPLGVRTGAGQWLVGLLAACSAASAFLGYQHMTGHLAAHSLFPLAGAAVLGLLRQGGLRRQIYTALLMCATIAMFADGAPVLPLMGVAAVLANLRRLPRALARLTALAGVAAVVAPFTLFRAGIAGYNTLSHRVPAAEPVFPQRGWLPKSPLDDLATLTGVDPWPPWPGAWPPLPSTLVTWSAALAGVVLLGFGVATLRRRRGEVVLSVVLGGCLVLAAMLIDVDYLAGKVLLTAAAFAVPLLAVGAARLMRRWATGLVVLVFLGGEIVALRELWRPSRFHVIDTPAHDALVAELARLPPQSSVAFDGLGAPTDAVLDAHRAQRAALLADLRPIHPGLDGGFYRPMCEDSPRPPTLPARGYALQRLSSENLTKGRLLAQWNGFRLVEADFARPEAFVAAWAPTHNWLQAEREPDGRVFRWAERSARATLRVLGPAPCARLRGQLRVVRGEAVIEIKVADDLAYKGHVTPDWSHFDTRPLATEGALAFVFEIIQRSVSAPDAAHAFAVSKLEVEPIWRCGTTLVSGRAEQAAELPIDLTAELALTVVPPVAAPCSEITFTMAGAEGRTFTASIDDGAPTIHYMRSPTESGALAIEGERTRKVTFKRPAEPPEERWRLVDLGVTPRRCEPK